MVGTVGATPPPPQGGGSPMIPCSPQVVKTFFRNFFSFFCVFFLRPHRFYPTLYP